MSYLAPRSASIATAASSSMLQPVTEHSASCSALVADGSPHRSVARGREQWYVVNDKVRHPHCNIAELVMGNAYQFRVRAVNDVGVGDEAFTKEFAEITKEKIEWNKPSLGPINMDCAPKFTTSLNNRNMVLSLD